jgi:hypothetical protein
MVVWSPNLLIAFVDISFHWGPKTCPYLHNQVLWRIHPPIYCLHMPKPKFQLHMASWFSLHPPMRRPVVISRKSLPMLITRLLNWHHEFHLIIRLFGLFNIDYNLVQCLGLLFLSCLNQLVFLLTIFVCMSKSLSHLLDCTTLFHLKFGHELHEKSQIKNQLINNAWSRWVLTIWFN